MFSKASRGFTLIELLIVVAIIAILAAIAVPNFLEAQVRAKISRVMSDQRTLATGLEAYAVDNNRPPMGMPEYSVRTGIWIPYRHWCYSALTTPVAYYTGWPTDPFGGSPDFLPESKYYEFETLDTRGWYYPGDYEYDEILYCFGLGYTWIVNSPGPSQQEWPPWIWMPMVLSAPEFGTSVGEAMGKIYSATNGTMSIGRLARTNKGVVPDGGSKAGF